MVGDPIVDGLVVLLRVLDVLVHLVRVVLLTRLVPSTWTGTKTESGGNEMRDGVRVHTHVDTDGEAFGVDLLGSLDVDVVASSWRRRVEARVVRGELTTVGWKRS